MEVGKNSLLELWAFVKQNKYCLLSSLVSFVAYYPSHSVKKPSYLNTGLTSTKNYGKTILTKVCFTLFLKSSSLTKLITGYVQF